MGNFRNILLVIFIFGLIVIAKKDSCATNRPVVHYDQIEDRISILASDASLHDLLGEIAFKSGIDVSMAPSAERQVSLEIDNLSIENALQNMAQQLGLSQMLLYASSEPGNPDARPLVIGVKIVGTGSKNFSTVKAVLTPVQQASSLSSVHRASDSPPPGQTTVPDMRWQSRLQRLPADQREELETLAGKMAKKKAEREQHRVDKDQRRQERFAKHLEEAKANDPERYDRLLERQQRKASQHNASPAPVGKTSLIVEDGIQDQ